MTYKRAPLPHHESTKIKALLMSPDFELLLTALSADLAANKIDFINAYMMPEGTLGKANSITLLERIQSLLSFFKVVENARKIETFNTIEINQ